MLKNFPKNLKILVTGADGQLAKALKKYIPKEINAYYLTKKDLDISNPELCFELVKKIKPNWIINCGAYTNVDKAESEEELAFDINANAPKALVSALKEFPGRLLQISTDYVFSGFEGSPYKTFAQKRPLNVYGKSKSLGEEHALMHDDSIVVRTSWLYGPIGHNFLLNMIKLHSSRNSFRVVSDQISCPTSTHSLAKACCEIIINDLDEKIIHWSDCGAASWFDFALAIGELASEKGILKAPARVDPIESSDFNSVAERPKNSLLNCFDSYELLKYKPRHWRAELSCILDSIQSGKSS